jgi:hypothetical protein
MEIIGKIIDFIKEKWGVRIALEILLFIGGACLTLFFISHSTTYGQLLVVWFWTCAAGWYFWFFHRKRFPLRSGGHFLPAALLSLLHFSVRQSPTG